MNWRKNHRIIGLIITVPLTITVVTGIILQLRGQFEFIQPSPVKSEIKKDQTYLSFEKISEIAGAENVDQIIMRPGKGTLVVRLKDQNELHLHPQTGEVLKKSLRRTNFLIELHQGSWLGPFGQFGIHFLSGLGLFFLILSGLFLYPFKRKRV